MFQDVEYNDGSRSRSLEVDKAGFNPSDAMKTHSGSKYVGYVSELSGNTNTISLSMGRPLHGSNNVEGNSYRYFDGMTIHSYCLLK